MEFQLSLLCFALATSLLRFCHVSGSPELFQTCRNSFSCGDIDGIGYPFRGSNDPDYCGYPGMKLSCDRRVTKIEIVNSTYRVMDINPETRTMTVARVDVFESACPTDLVNTTLDSNSFDYTTSSLNLTFLYGCPISGFSLPELNPVSSCKESGVLAVPGSVGPSGCRESVVYPVYQPGGGGPVNYTGLDLILRRGFEIRWKADSSICGECFVSNGSCGYDLITRQTKCYCPNPPYVGMTACRAVSSIGGN